MSFLTGDLLLSNSHNPPSTPLHTVYMNPSFQLERSDNEFTDKELSYKQAPSIPLTPFTSQVGGHSSFLRFSDRILCKPLVPSEQMFYERADEVFPALKQFMAAYLGIVNVTFKRDAPSQSINERYPH